jgi:hypothetical protein
MRRAAILQSAYIPWRGYFDLISSVDEFIFYDDVQISKGDWRNRNIIRTNNGNKWLTIPIPKKNRIHMNICDIHCSNDSWRKDHINKINDSYCKSPYYQDIIDVINPLYYMEETRLSSINEKFIRRICEYLGISTRISWSSEYEASAGKSQRLADLCRAVDADVYVSGPAAKDYLDIDLFRKAGIEVEWFSYESLKPYPQLHGSFEGMVSIVDLLFNVGPRSNMYIPSCEKLLGSGLISSV